MEEFASLKSPLLRSYSAPFEFPPFSSAQLWLLVEIIKQKVLWYFWHYLKFFTLLNLIKSQDFISGRALRRSVQLCHWIGGSPSERISAPVHVSWRTGDVLTISTRRKPFLLLLYADLTACITLLPRIAPHLEFSVA